MPMNGIRPQVYKRLLNLYCAAGYAVCMSGGFAFPPVIIRQKKWNLKLTNFFKVVAIAGELVYTLLNVPIRRIEENIGK